MTSYRCYWLLHTPLLSRSLWKAPFCRVWLFLISAVLYAPLIFLPFLVIPVTSFCSQKGLKTDKQENSCPVICWQDSISSFLHGSFRAVLPHRHQLRKIKKFPPNSSDRNWWKKQKFIQMEVDTVSSGSSFLHLELLKVFLALSHGFRNVFEVYIRM